MKNKKDGGGIGDKSFFRLHKKFCKFSPRGPPLTGSGKIDRENKSKGSVSQLMDDLDLIIEQVEVMVNSIQKGVENVLRK